MKSHSWIDSFSRTVLVPRVAGPAIDRKYVSLPNFVLTFYFSLPGRTPPSASKFAS